MLSDDAIAGLMLEDDLTESVSDVVSPANVSADASIAHSSSFAESVSAGASTNPFLPSNPFYTKCSPILSSHELLRNLDRVISRTEPEKDFEKTEQISAAQLAEKSLSLCGVPHERKTSPQTSVSHRNSDPSNDKPAMESSLNDIKDSTKSPGDIDNRDTLVPSISPNKGFPSPSGSPQTRPSSLPLTRRHTPSPSRAVPCFATAEKCYPETVTVTDSTEESVSSCGSENPAKSSTTPAYAPLQDALESPLTSPPNFPPPPPPKHY